MVTETLSILTIGKALPWHLSQMNSDKDGSTQAYTPAEHYQFDWCARIKINLKGEYEVISFSLLPMSLPTPNYFCQTRH